jgi:hypothetical protein
MCMKAIGVAIVLMLFCRYINQLLVNHNNKSIDQSFWRLMFSMAFVSFLIGTSVQKRVPLAAHQKLHIKVG